MVRVQVFEPNLWDPIYFGSDLVWPFKGSLTWSSANRFFKEFYLFSQAIFKIFDLIFLLLRSYFFAVFFSFINSWAIHRCLYCRLLSAESAQELSRADPSENSSSSSLRKIGAASRCLLVVQVVQVLFSTTLIDGTTSKTEGGRGCEGPACNPACPNKLD